MLREAGVERHAVSELLVSYRVPREFLALASTLLPPGAPSPRGVRDAPWPAVAVQAASVGEVAAVLAARMARAVGSVGVVAPAVCIDDVRAGLAAAVEFSDGMRAPLSAGINLLDLHVTKGLEFDAIVVVEPAAILEQRPDGGAGGLYTALTRSTRALAIVHARPLPAPLRDAPDLQHVDDAFADGN